MSDEKKRVKCAVPDDPACATKPYIPKVDTPRSIVQNPKESSEADALETKSVDTFLNHVWEDNKTYTVGLRLPESLCLERSELVRRNEIIRFLLNKTDFSTKNFEHFKRFKNLRDGDYSTKRRRHNSSNENMVLVYQNLFSEIYADFQNYGRDYINQQLVDNTEKIKTLSRGRQHDLIRLNRIRDILDFFLFGKLRCFSLSLKKALDLFLEWISSYGLKNEKEIKDDVKNTKMHASVINSYRKKYSELFTYFFNIFFKVANIQSEPEQARETIIGDIADELFNNYFIDIDDVIKLKSDILSSEKNKLDTFLTIKSEPEQARGTTIIGAANTNLKFLTVYIYKKIEKTIKNLRDETELKTAAPFIKDERNPLPTEIPSYNYEFIASRSLYFVSRYINTLARGFLSFFFERLKENYKDPAKSSNYINATLNYFNLNGSEGNVSFAPSQDLAGGISKKFKDFNAIEQEFGFGFLPTQDYVKSASVQAFSLITAYTSFVKQFESVLNSAKGGNDNDSYFLVLPVLLSYYSPPSYFVAEQSSIGQLNVDFKWLRNAIVGWRRKIDSKLPEPFQIQSITKDISDGKSVKKSFFTNVFEHYSKFCRSHLFITINEKEKETLLDAYTLNLLRKLGVLHLLDKDIDLSSLLPEDVRDSYYYLKKRAIANPFPISQFPNRLISLSVSDLTKSIAEIKRRYRKIFGDLKNRITTLKNENLNETNTEIKRLEKKLENIKSYLEKNTFIQQFIQEKNILFEMILKNFLVGNRYTRSIEALIVNLSKDKKYKWLFTSLRDIIALALATKHKTAIEKFMGEFTSFNCITQPFKSLKKKAVSTKTLSPILTFQPNAGIFRQMRTSNGFKDANFNDVTISFRNFLENREPLWLGVPIYFPDQFDYKKGVLKIDDKHILKSSSHFWFRLFPSQKHIDCLNYSYEENGIRIYPATIATVKFRVRTRPTPKIYADLVINSPKKHASNVFAHSNKFLKQWDRELPLLKESINKLRENNVIDYLGSDINPIGENLLSVSAYLNNNNSNSRLGELDLISGDKNLMTFPKRSREKIDLYRKSLIPALSRNKERLQRKIVNLQNTSLSKPVKSNIDYKLKNKLRRINTEISLLYRKRKNITKETKLHLPMAYLYLAYLTDAKYLSWDNLFNIDTKGKKRELAEAITLMPKNKDQFNYITTWANDLKNAGFLERFVRMLPVSPYTSEYCASCYLRTGGLKKSRKKGISYHEFECTDLDCSSPRSLSRHHNASNMACIFLKNTVESLGLKT